MFRESEAEEYRDRCAAIGKAVDKAGCDALLVSSKANNFYAGGRIIMGYTYIMKDGKALYFVRRPAGLKGDNVVYINKPADIAGYLGSLRLLPSKLMFEGDTMSVGDFERMKKIFPDSEMINGSGILREARSVKTPFEIKMIRESGKVHAKTYGMVPELFEDGMTDIELNIRIEEAMRRNGSLGISRIAGDTMELHVTTVLAGDNADAVSPYDFATTGAGVDKSFPVGQNGSVIEDGMSVMVDGCANKHGYLSDMTRVFAVGELPEEALKAYDLSREIYKEMVSMLTPGTKCSDIYHRALKMAVEAGFGDYFMGHNQQAGFVGHGVGIELNEAPVLAPRSKEVIKKGMVLALEPKFVIPGVGVLGIENTVAVTEYGIDTLTVCDESLIQLKK